MEKASLCVVCSDASRLEFANSFASEHGFPFYAEKNPNYALQLCFLPAHVELHDTELATGIHVDFINGPLAHREQFGLSLIHI